MYAKVSEILSAKWLIDRETVVSYYPLLLAFLNGQKFSGDGLIPSVRKKPIAASEGDNFLNPVNPLQLSDPSIPVNSVAVIPIDGVLCSWDTMELIGYIQQAIANPNIISILFVVNTPGGMITYLDLCANEIKNSPKPTVGLIMNLAASAGMWLTSAMDYRIAISPMARIGSIGVMTSYVDMSILLKEKLGIVASDFYASKSTRKNEDVRSFIADPTNTALFTAELDFINEIFHATIMENLGIKADSEVLTGAIYYAQQAMDLGLINEINSIDFAFHKAYELGLVNILTNYKFS